MIYTIMKYYGSKRRMVAPIRSCLPEDYKVWIEGCMGSGAVSINRDCPEECMTNIVNEKGTGMYTFWNVFADKEKGLELMDMISRCEGSERDFREARWNVAYRPRGMSDVEYAKCVYLEVALSFSGTRKGYSRQKRNFPYRVEHHLRPVYEKFQREQVKVFNWDMLDLLREIERQPECKQREIMVYLDPPYLHGLRAKSAHGVYEKEMSEEEHLKMLGLLRRVKCKVLLSGYFNKDLDIYSEYLLPYGYQCYFGGEYKKSCSRKDTEMGAEYLWCNYELPKGCTLPKVNYKHKIIWTA